MKISHIALIVPFAAALAAFAQPAKADFSGYSTEPAAAKACGADEVVWVDLSKGRFYSKAQSEYGAAKNGIYACMKAAHALYRAGQSAPTKTVQAGQ